MHDHHPDHTEPRETPLDEWHQHDTADEGLPQTEHGAHANITALLITFVVITGATVVFSVIIGLYAINQISRKTAQAEAAGLDAIAPAVTQYKDEALAAQTAAYHWTAEGKVRLPIEQAMEKVVAEYQESQGQ